MRIKSILTYSVIIFFCLLLINGCKKKYTPKPRGYFRIDLPEKKYQKLESNYPFVFNYPEFTVLNKDSSNSHQKYWFNIEYPELNGKIHIIPENLTLLDLLKMKSFKES